MNKKMKLTAVDVIYTFDELEEYAKENIVYDIQLKLDISEEEALDIAKGGEYNYLATLNYEI